MVCIKVIEAEEKIISVERCPGRNRKDIRDSRMNGLTDETTDDADDAAGGV